MIRLEKIILELKIEPLFLPQLKKTTPREYFIISISEPHFRHRLSVFAGSKIIPRCMHQKISTCAFQLSLTNNNRVSGVRKRTYNKYPQLIQRHKLLTYPFELPYTQKQQPRLSHQLLLQFLL